MPKKFKGENTKAQDARARKAAVKHAEKDKKEKEKEDEYWRDDDKNANKKQQRKTNKELKKQEIASRKKELGELYENEMNSLPGKKVIPNQTINKVTRSEIQRHKEVENQTKPAATRTKQNLSTQDLLTDNINQVLATETVKGSIDARTVEEAISALGVEDKLDRHPERRQRAAFNKFQDDNMERIKQENPNMRLSQWKQILHREWKKSPDNPMNQASIAYNAKP